MTHQSTTRCQTCGATVTNGDQWLIAALREALEIIAGRRQCVDNLLSNADVARAALSLAETECSDG